MPFEDYQKLRGWIKNKDRERFSGYLGKGIRQAINDTRTGKSGEDLKAMEGGRAINPVQEQVMRNPVVGLFMQGTAFANMPVRSITLDDRNKNYVKEHQDGLEEAKKNLDEREIDRKYQGIKMPWAQVKAQEEREKN